MKTREKILDEALRLFARRGYDAVSVTEIADAVGIKAPSLYKHYSSKRAIFDSIIEHSQGSSGSWCSDTFQTDLFKYLSHRIAFIRRWS